MDQAEGYEYHTGADHSPPFKQNFSNVVAVLNQDAVEKLPSQVPLDDTTGAVPNTTTLSIQPNSPETLNSRKRRAGSDVPATDLPLRTDSPFKVSRQSSSNFRDSPDSPAKYHFPQHALNLRSPGRQGPISPSQQLYARKPNEPFHGSGFYQEQPADRKPARGHASKSSSMAVQWSRNRPRGPHVTVNDSIAALTSIFGAQALTPNFAFLGSGDAFSVDDEPDDLPVNTSIIKQPESRPISQQQLATEVKGIYSGLVMVEGKCVGVVNEQNQETQQAKSGEQRAALKSQVEHFPALIALHRTLLHEHHDFFLASQHPSAGKGIKELATKYSMPARMWKHGIHNFLELLRRRLPESLDYMLAFIYLAYQMMALLFETVPTFKDTWIECLGDLARYRMAIEDEDIRDREVWTAVAKFWYMRAADQNPDIGRLLHHLGILARSNALAQLSLYCRSLTAKQPFTSSRESIMTLFEPALTRLNKASPARPMSNDMWFVIAHACMFGVKVTSALLERARSTFLSGLDAQIAQLNMRWRESGAFIASCNIASLHKYGCTDSTLRSVEMPKEKPSGRPSCPSPPREQGAADPDDIADDDATDSSVSDEWRFTLSCLNIALRRVGDANVLPLVSVMLVFFWALCSTPQGAAYIDRFIRWDLVARFVNALKSELDSNISASMLESATLSRTEGCPLPEDYHLRGQVYSDGLFPADWFAEAPIDIDERFIEQHTFSKRRAYRIKWLAGRIALSNTFKQAMASGTAVADTAGSTPQPSDSNAAQRHRWLHYDITNDMFSVAQWLPTERDVALSSDGEPMSGVTPG